MKRITIVTFVLLFFTTMAQAQLANFNFSVSKTDETCLGNASLTFTVSNTTPNATMLYKVFKLPNTNTPVAILAETYLGSLGSGTYKVVAIQTFGSLSNSKEQNITINKQIADLKFNLTTANQSCASGGSIVVNTTSGTFASCEILNGPEIRPLQASNVFANLPAGTYKIRVFDTCGVGKVKTYTMSLISAVLNIGATTYPDLISPICDSITVVNTISTSAGTINYPLNVKHTLNVLDIAGNPVEINQYFATGPNNNLAVSAVVPRYLTDTFNYDITVTDFCNAQYEKLDNVVDPSILLGLTTGQAKCANKFLKLNAVRFTDSYTVEFLDAPAGFNPQNFNSTPAGPFTQSNITYGSSTNTVPFGTYVVKITDTCGRTATTTLEVEFIMLTASVGGYNNGCFSLFGRINASVPNQTIVSAMITEAPGTYVPGTPHDVTSQISNQGELNLYDLPIGWYTIKFTDDCGFEYEERVEVPPFVERDFFMVTLPGCEAGFGGVKMQSGNGDLTSVKIVATTAPLGVQLPYDVTENINGAGDFYMANLPQGSYTFEAVDICGIVKSNFQINVEGYNPPQTPFVYTANCGNFSIKVTDDSNGTEGVSYWLQKYFPNTGTWGHPGTGAAYAEGTVPVAENAIKLSNNVARNNNNWTGKFRIVKKFETFTTDSNENTICISLFDEFTYYDELTINTAYTLACVGSPNDVMLEVTGQPTSFTIIEKNGQPFSFDNGASNVFVNIEPAEYVFRIEDDCNNVIVQGYNVLTLPSIADATQPTDMIACVETASMSTYQFNLKDQDDDILGELFSASYTITYHLTFEDADEGVNALPTDYTSLSNGQTIYARLIHNEISLCHGVTSFKLFIGEYQEPTITTEGTICDDGRLKLTANAGYDNYEWSTGETTRSIYVEEAGVYSVIVEKAYGTTSCGGEAQVEIKASFTPEIVKIDTEDWTDDNNTIIVHAEGIDLQYSLDGQTYQDENIFTGLETGIYTVYVKDAHGCGQDIEEVVLLNYPRYFTPNGDGVHETWYIKHANMEPNLKVTVMDRYGKLITAFGSASNGWDGTLNGIQLPSTDYWFVVTREDGRELKGHFSMLR